MQHQPVEERQGLQNSGGLNGSEFDDIMLQLFFPLGF
jgi:hypothetical protein